MQLDGVSTWCYLALVPVCAGYCLCSCHVQASLVILFFHLFFVDSTSRNYSDHEGYHRWQSTQKFEKNESCSDFVV